MLKSLNNKKQDSEHPNSKGVKMIPMRSSCCLYQRSQLPRSLETPRKYYKSLSIKKAWGFYYLLPGLVLSALHSYAPAISVTYSMVWSSSPPAQGNLSIVDICEEGFEVPHVTVLFTILLFKFV